MKECMNPNKRKPRTTSLSETPGKGAPIRANTVEKWLSANDPLGAEFELTFDDDFMQGLHDSIMAAVDTKAILEPSWTHLPKTWLKRSWKSYSITGFAAFTIAVLFVSGMKFFRELPSQQGAQKIPDNFAQTEVLAQAVSQVPRLSESLISYQSENDFFVDLADNSFNHLSVDDLNKKLMDTHTTR